METINAFPGYEYVPFGEDKKPHNMYKGEDVGFGGYVFAIPGMYGRTVCFDVSGMHPASIRALNYLGAYTKNYADLVDARTAIKHKDFDSAKKMLNGKLAPYLTDESKAKDLSKALKLAQNSVYGLTSANFDNPFRDSRNVNNIVALRGALFMVNLKHEIQSRGFTVIHCKTDSIKVVEPSDEIFNFIIDYGKKYGYNFEVEHVFDKICLVNNAVYIAKLSSDDPENPGKWTATGTQFQVPYVFKKLFSKEPIEFDDLCETKSVTSALYLDMNENLPDVSEAEKVKTLRKTSEDQISKSEFNLMNGKSSHGFKWSDVSDEELDDMIASGHNYIFIGKVGRFCPIKPGHGGGLLCREAEDKKTGEKKYVSATGAKGYRWLESELVKELGKEDSIDRSYYDTLANEAIDAISKYGDFYQFVSDDSPNQVEAPWFNPSEPWSDEHETTAFDVR